MYMLAQPVLRRSTCLSTDVATDFTRLSRTQILIRRLSRDSGLMAQRRTFLLITTRTSVSSMLRISQKSLKQERLLNSNWTSII